MVGEAEGNVTNIAALVSNGEDESNEIDAIALATDGEADLDVLLFILEVVDDDFAALLRDKVVVLFCAKVVGSNAALLHDEVFFFPCDGVEGIGDNAVIPDTLSDKGDGDDKSLLFPRRATPKLDFALLSSTKSCTLRSSSISSSSSSAGSG